MAEFNRADNIVLLFDYYGDESQMLHTSFLEAGYNLPAVVINDDGFLPDDLISVYGYFLGDYKNSEKSLGKPRYFNGIDIPKFWEISGTNTNGEICDKGKKKAGIFYNYPYEKRLVKAVDWDGDKGKVRLSEHYNKYGALWATTAFNKEGQRVLKTYLSPEGREIIYENFVTGDIILNEDKKVTIFKNKTEFVIYFLKKAGLVSKRLIYNSLSTPFFVSQMLEPNGFKDILFWQERADRKIPGNMQIIFDNNATRCKKVFVQNQSEYDNLLNIGAPSDMVSKLGNIYKFLRSNGHRKNVLICTNSDSIEHLKELITGMPYLTFHIAAITEMSSKLMETERYGNVKLYPGVKPKVLDELFKNCDFYFDINYGSEIADAVRRAFLNNMFITAFSNTAHNTDYLAPEHIFKAHDADDLKELVKRAADESAFLDECVDRQKKAALSEVPASYVF
ncbi:MAG: accessory Sec system glycosylation chaperone GtfB [Eubacterium sp.]|nr:accessory Sec system glycosylation chaperone GtfB [Eubacterium sp.]